MAMFFRTPFAINGDRQTIPNDAQSDGSESYTDGYTSDYEGDFPTDPNAKPVPRLTMNEILYEITLAMQQYQANGIPDFITTADNGGSPYPYNIFALVRYDPGTGIQVYQSLINANTDLPTTSNWRVFTNGFAAPNGQYIQTYMSSTAVTTPNPVMAVSPLLFNTVNFTSLGNILNPANGRITPNQPGAYQVIARVHTVSTTTNFFGEGQFYISKNSSTNFILDSNFVGANINVDSPGNRSSGTVMLQGSTIVRANGTTDYFNMSFNGVGTTGSGSLQLVGGINNSEFTLLYLGM